jgi:hypothetical protein
MSVGTAAAASRRYPGREFRVHDECAARSLKERFFGRWKLVSWKIEQTNSDPIDPPIGPNPLGWIMYHPGGYMCVALMRPERPQFVSNSLMEATPEEVKAAFDGYVSYCGSYEVNAQERFVIHRLELSWFPNWVGTEQKRFFEFAGDRLTLTTPPLPELGDARVHRLIWQRVI